jgi:hypothetical protein
MLTPNIRRFFKASRKLFFVFALRFISGVFSKCLKIFCFFSRRRYLPGPLKTRVAGPLSRAGLSFSRNPSRHTR